MKISARPRANGITARCFNFSPSAKNSVIIQKELATIQQITAKLWYSSDLVRRDLQPIRTAKLIVGKIIKMPSDFQLISQLMSLSNQSRMWKFSILRSSIICCLASVVADWQRGNDSNYFVVVSSFEPANLLLFGYKNFQQILRKRPWIKCLRVK